MSWPYILAYKYPAFARPAGFIAGLLLALGFCLQNARLIPGVPGEYQPTIFLAGCLLALITWGAPRKAWVASLLLLLSLTAPIGLHWLTGDTTLPELILLLRLLVGPALLVGVAAAWKQIDYRWLWLALITHLIFAAIGMWSAEFTTQAVTALGVRINDISNPNYYPWSAFFYAEYSYAALAFITLYCWINARPEAPPHRLLFISLTVALLLATRSATAIALLGIVLLSQLRWCWVLALPVVLVITFFISPRAALFFNAVAQAFHGHWEIFIQQDVSSAWRFASNLGAFNILQANPLGTLDVDLRPYLQAANAPAAVDQLIRWWLNSYPAAPAQGVAFNYGLFGGWITFIGIISVYLFACVNVFCNKPKCIALALAMLCFYALFIQSALTNLTPWITLGIMLGASKAQK